MTRVAAVTGGSSGIGRAVASDLAVSGYKVIVLDLQQPDDPFPPGITLVTGDACDPHDNERVVRTALDQHGGLDLFVGNAGIHDAGVRLRDLSGAELAVLTRRVLEVDVISYLLGARAAAGPLASRGGSMIFTLSDASFVVSGNGAGVAYCAAKHAALGLIRHLAADLAPDVRVNAVAPGGVVTGLRAAVGASDTRPVYDRATEISETIRAFNPLKVVLTAQQIAPLYRFLASEAAAGLTGEVLRPDGGLAVR